MLFNGLRAIFGAALAPLFADGVLHKTTTGDDGAGGFTPTMVDIAVKALIKGVSEKDRVASGLPLNTVNITVLRAGLPVSIDIDDSLTVDGATYRVVAAGTDPGQASFALTAVPA